MTRLAIALLCLFTCLTAVRAEEPPACTGTDLAAKLKAENPAAYDAVIAEAEAIPNGQAIFWKIEHADVAASYLLGTAHVTDDRVTTLTPEVETALIGADVAAFELQEVANRERFALAAFGLARYMVLPAGTSLWDMIPDDQETLIRHNPNLMPGTIGGIFGYQPWVVATTLSIPLCEALRAKSGIMPLDTKLASLAAEKGIPILGLETMEEQFAILAAMPLDQQLVYLMSVAKNAMFIPDQFETLISLYQQRQITAMIPLMLRLQPLQGDEKRILEYVERDLIIKRNYRMAERAAPMLARGNAFIAVGALHLPGKEGVVELLRRAGYKVTAIN